MDLSIFTWFGYKYPFIEIIKLIKQAGFQSVMTWWGDDYIETDIPKALKPEIIRKNGLKLENVHFPFYGINNIWLDSLDGQEYFNKFIKYIDECKTHEIPTAVIHVSSGYNPPPLNQLGLDRFKKIIEKAEKENINIALENLKIPEYLNFIYKNIESEKLKFCYDSGHENCFTPNYNYLEKYKDKIISLHLHDNNGLKDEHLLPFDGTIDWKNTMEKIRSIEYKGSLSLEIDVKNNKLLNKYTAEEYLLEAKNRAYKLLEI